MHVRTVGRRWLRTAPVLLGLLGAGVCFTWALATTAPATPPSPVISRLQITNPFLGSGVSPDFPNGGNIGADFNAFALGDACLGQSVNRQLSAFNGFPPYVWSSVNASTLGLALDMSGRVTGTLGSIVSPGVNFSATVIDASGTQRTGIFFLTPRSCGIFHFASDVLPQAAIGQDFITTLDVVSPPAAASTYSVVAGSILLNGAALPDLESAGFHLFSDGTLAGRPLTAGTLSFTAAALSNGIHAARRDGSAPDQPLTLTIAPPQTLTSAFATRRLQVTAGNPGKDSLTLTALLETGGFSANAFKGKPFTLRIGASIFTSTFGSSDKNFRTSFNNSNGQLTVQLRNQDFSKLLNATPASGSVRTVVQVSLATIFQGVEVLQLETRASGNRFQLRYDLTHDVSPGGLFQISLLRGINFQGTLLFQVNFVIEPVGGTPLNADTATLSIGPVYSQTVSLRNNHVQRAVGGVSSFSINAKRHTGVLFTNPLDPASVGVSTSATGKAQSFRFRLDLSGPSGPFSGMGAEVIGPNFSFPIFVPVIIVPVFDDGCDIDDCFDDFAKKNGT